jgi:hypothetical protein
LVVINTPHALPSPGSPSTPGPARRLVPRSHRL